MQDNYGEFHPPFNQDPPYAPPTVAGGYPYPQQGTVQGAAPVYVPYPVPVAVPSTGDGVALASLILGIISAAIGWIPICGFIIVAPAIVGIVLGALGLKSERRRWMGIAGILLSVIGIVLAFIIFL